MSTELQRIRDAVRYYDGTLEYSNTDGGPRAPDGDDYNELFWLIMNDAQPDLVRDAAAEMLATLRAIVARRQGIWDDPNLLRLCGPIGTEADDIERMALAAIAKAEGRV